MNANWKLQFRDDQTQFLIASMNYLMARCDNRIFNTNDPLAVFTAEQTKERAVEIRDYIQSVTT